MIVYSAGNVCTYHVDDGISYREEVDSGQSCLHPASFVPEKEGWEFEGWGLSGSAELPAAGEVLMGDEPVELYALFRQDVTLTTVANGVESRETKTRLYNSGDLVNPVFTVASPAKSGAAFKGWSSAAGSTAVTDTAITGMELDASITRWAVFQYANSAAIAVGMKAWPSPIGWYDYQNYTYQPMNLCSVDCSKYDGAQIYINGGYCEANGNSTFVYLGVRLSTGSPEKYIQEAYVGAGGDVHEPGRRYVGAVTLTGFPNSGTHSVQGVVKFKGYQAKGCYLNLNGNGSVTLLGRTVVG